MNSLLIKDDDYGILILLFFGIPIILWIIALTLRQKKPKTAKVLGIITAVYLVISRPLWHHGFMIFSYQFGYKMSY